ncbi:MAG TPA: response regulator transcription factor [Tepidisphaeraceae bacterium]|jgi:DNA-binding response OmpR family regulator
MKVLVIEDFQLLRESLTKGLREAGFTVDATGDGEEGLWYATSGGEYDVIILDIMLPRVDGLTILKKLRARRSEAHVLVLTAKDTLDDRVAGLNLGADDYLVKPFAFVELLARVRALVRRKYESKSPVIRVEDMEIDTERRLVRRGGQSIELSAREYAVLELLASRAGKVVTRSDIWEHVYEFDSEADSNVVDVYIGHLRRKIEADGLPRLIHTRRGHGYVLGEAE